MTAAALDPSPPLPPIVLLVDPHRDTLERYARCLENGGLWVARMRLGAEAIAAAEELRPDIIVADSDALDGDHSAVESLKGHPTLSSVPVIALASVAEDAAGADAVLLKPVEPLHLLARANALLARSRSLRSRSDAALDRGRGLRMKASEILQMAERATALSEHTRRLCPECGSRLEWVERGSIGAVTYDYYRWCLKGCGLFCFDCNEARWVKLA